MAKKNETYPLPSFISFFIPGVGQFMKGHTAKGIMFLLAMFLAWSSLIVLIGLILVPVVHIWSGVDAYKSNKKY